MPQWTERITSHPFYAELVAVETALDQALSVQLDDAEAVTSLDRIRTVIRRCGVVFRSTDPGLIHPSVVGNAHSYAQNVRSELQAFVSNQNIGHLSNANSQLDNLLPQLAQIPRGTDDQTLFASKEAVDAVRSASAQSIVGLHSQEVQLNSQLKALETRIQELVTDIANQKVRLDTAIAQQQEQFSQNEETRRATAARAEQEREQAAREEVHNRAATFDSFVTSGTERLNHLVSQASERFDKTHDELATAFGTLERDVSAQLERARKIVGIISESGMVHGYRRVANEEQSSATKWHWIAGGSMVGLIGFAIFAFVATLGNAFSWGTFGGRAFVALTFGVLAAYAARQADKHEQVERRNRRLELELAALDPFLEPLPEPERFAVKRLMADRLFGQPDATPIAASSETTGSVIDLLRLAIQGLSKK